MRASSHDIAVSTLLDISPTMRLVILRDDSQYQDEGKHSHIILLHQRNMFTVQEMGPPAFILLVIYNCFPRTILVPCILSIKVANN